MTEILILGIFSLGVWGVITRRNMVKKIIAMSLINCSLVLLFVLGGAELGKKAPILLSGSGIDFVDPLPQALMLTAIVVGFCVTALALVLAVRLFEEYGTLDLRKIEDSANADTD
jgi:multicomponent Na+:H+ antiporter subunit C